jgi:hypothetical protein
LDYTKGYFVAGLSEIEDKLTADLVRSGKEAGLAVIVFANAQKPFVKSEILPLVNYWNYRSKDYATFFFVGHIGDQEAGEFFARLDVENSFHEQVFVETIEHFENKSHWKYRGDTPLILCRGYLASQENSGDPRAFLDLDSIIEFELERALREKAIESVEAFFEVVIRVAKETPGEEVHWKLSDKLGVRALGDAFIEAVADKLKGTKRIINAVRFFRVTG